MTTYNTGNPIGSQDPRDLFDNAGNLDHFALSSEPTYKDRLGQDRLTMHAIQTSVPDAIEARDTAVLARDAAIAAAGPMYATEAEGRAAVADGETFKVQGSGFVAARVYRRTSATTSDLIAEFPSAKQIEVIPQIEAALWPYVEEIINSVSVDEQGRRWMLTVGDQLRNVFAVLQSGGMQVGNVQSIVEAVNALSDISARTLYRMLPDGTLQLGNLRIRVSGGGGIYISDSLGRTRGITRNGRIIGGSAVKTQQRLNYRNDPGFKLAQINHVIVGGQSLARGGSAGPAISLVQPYSNLMFKSGPFQRPGDPAYDASAFLPLVEDSSSVVNVETPISGICNGLVRRLVAEGEMASDWVMLGSTYAMGNRTIENQLEEWLPKGKQQIVDAKALADAQGKAYAVAAHVFLHGEKNHGPGDGTRTSFGYDQIATELHEELVRFAQEVTGQAFAPYFVTYQVGAHRWMGSDTMHVAIQQWRSSRMHPWHVLAIPNYILPRAPDGLHLTNESSWRMGEYVNRALHHTLYRSEGKWRPLEPVNVLWTDTQIDIKWHVPCGPIVIDDALCATVAHAGFALRAADSTVLDLISGVSVISDDTIRITLSAPAPADATLTCGRGLPADPATSGPIEGPRTNIRDSHGLYDTATSPLGNTFALHNPAVMFEYNRQKGL